MPKSIVNRFIRYVKVHTTSKEDIDKIPSTDRQFELADMLVRELKELGIEDALVNENCIVTGTLLSNLTPEETAKVPVLCFNAHLDTSPEEPGKDVNPIIIKNYQGGDIKLPSDQSVIISSKETPDLEKFIGSDIITTDGTTLLGADDKAGIAEIMTAIATLKSEPKRKHGTIKIVFTPDEEVGKGTDALDIDSIGADYAYTLDGDLMGVLEIETFNAAGGTITVKGYNIHPGYAYGKMINSIRIIHDLLALFPDEEAPETTKDYQGYFHVYKMDSSVNEGSLSFILRDFDYDNLKRKMEIIENGVKRIQEKHPGSEIILNMKESYKNMKEILDQHPLVVDNAKEAIKRAGLSVIMKPIRGGTDGARMSFMGLPTPNIFTGGMNFHSKKEFIPIIAMEKAVEAILNIIEIFVEKNTK